jgi:hypothetical protein
MTTNSPAAQPQGGELSPCPFCGARARLTIVAEHLAPAENGFPVHVECGGTASCFSHYFEDESAAIKFRNTRADLPRATAADIERERIVAMADALEYELPNLEQMKGVETLRKKLQAEPSRATGETTVEAALSGLAGDVSRCRHESSPRLGQVRAAARKGESR